MNNEEKKDVLDLLDALALQIHILVGLVEDNQRRIIELEGGDYTDDTIQ